MARQAQIFDVRDGEILLADVLDAAGHVLLRQGTVLSARQAQQLARRGVETVEVGSPEEAEADPGAPGPEEVAAVIERLEAAFEKLHGDALMDAIYRATRARVEAGKLSPR